jgi:hypothetical protein
LSMSISDSGSPFSQQLFFHFNLASLTKLHTK